MSGTTRQSVSILGGRVIDPASGRDEQTNVYVEGRVIAAIGDTPPAGFQTGISIDAGGRIVCPGLVELSASLREPGLEHKATIGSERVAAVNGGITALCMPPDTDPVIDEPSVMELIQKRAQQTRGARLFPLGALTAGLRGQNLSEMAALKEAGCAGISNALRPIQDSRVLRRAMEYAATYDLTLHAAPLDSALSKGGVAHEGPVATRLGLPGIPAAAETISLARYLALVEDVGVKVHFGRLSTARGVNMIAEAKARGLPVTADVAIHHLHLTETAVDNFNSLAHVIPPLRSAADRDALLAAVRSGTLDAICADHQPHNADAKLNPYPSTEPGISGLDTLLGLCLLLAQSGALTLAQALNAVTAAPARILGLPTGRLEAGAPADICIFDPRQSWVVGADTLKSAGHNTPFMGWELPGNVTQTLVDGQPML